MHLGSQHFLLVLVGVPLQDQILTELNKIKRLKDMP